MENETLATTKENKSENKSEGPQVLEEIIIEELSIDGVCGVY
ncbi:MAG: mycofactocin precursor [Chloroflexi bacterium RBG_16_50_9]|nr:MAG: mycofactocin precursor [Chloroflexi bacterium RBG_16_50_9]